MTDTGIVEREAKWQPRETAPKDGTQFIVWDTRYGFIPWVYWDEEYKGGTWMSENIGWSGGFTHWMPLPEPPNRGDGKE